MILSRRLSLRPQDCLVQVIDHTTLDSYHLAIVQRVAGVVANVLTVGFNVDGLDELAPLLNELLDAVAEAVELTL